MSLPAMNLKQALAYVARLDPEQRAAHIATVTGDDWPIWCQLEGPQEEAWTSEADIVFYGGAAGGGKTDLVLGLALEKHERTLIMRREGTQFRGIIQRLTEVLGTREGFNGTTKQWRVNDRQLIEMGSCPHLGDEINHQGIPHDLLAFDEITHFLEIQFRFLSGWNRTTTPDQRCRILCTGNPPTDPRGLWVKQFWAPWLDRNCPVKNRAEPGELRWYATIDGKDQPRADGTPFEHRNYAGNVETIQPRSRTFIPSKIENNPFLEHTGYKATLQSLPEPLRSQMLAGDFDAGEEDMAYQVIPTWAVEAAMRRWRAAREAGEPMGIMTQMGVDVARGGSDNTVLAPLHGKIMDELKETPGKTTPDGPTTVAYVVQHRRDGAVLKVDSIGVGSSVLDFMNQNNMPVVPINGAAGTQRKDKSGNLSYYNMRAQIYWMFREALMESDCEIQLPDDTELQAQLCAHTFKVRPGNKLLIDDKDEVKKLIGCSPDKADAVVYAYAEGVGEPSFTQGNKALTWDQPIQYPEELDRYYSGSGTSGVKRRREDIYGYRR